MLQCATRKPGSGGRGRDAKGVAQTPLLAVGEGEGDGGREDKGAASDEEGGGEGEEEGRDGASSPSAGLKRKLAFDEDLKRDGGSPRSDDTDKDSTGADRPTAPLARTNRTTATKVSNSLLKKIVNNQSGWDLKITGLIPYEQLARLCEALAENESTERLDLEGCAIGDSGCHLIRDLLAVTKHINHVDLQMNQITCVGCRALAEGLPLNSTLQRLYVGNNDIRDEGVLALIASMRRGRELEINVSGNRNVTEGVLQKLDKALDKQWVPVRKPLSTAPPRPTRAGSCSREPEESPRGGVSRAVREEPPMGLRGAVRAVKDDAKPFAEPAKQAGKEERARPEKRVRVDSGARVLGRRDRQAEGGGGFVERREGPTVELVRVGEDVYRGKPLSYVFSEKGVERDSVGVVRWGRVKQTFMEQMDMLCRELTVGHSKETLFESACAYLFGLHYAVSPKSKSSSLKIPPPPATGKNWLSDETERRRAVEGRVRSLILKFRHTIEDVARELSFHTEEPPIPCTFKLSVTVHGPLPLGDTEYNIC